jgi:hypothetical protein
MGYAAAEESFQAQAIVLRKLILGLHGSNLVLIFVTSVGSRAVLLSPFSAWSLASDALHVGPVYTGCLFDLCFREAAVSACELLSYCND